jgi:hypothetical protein
MPTNPCRESRFSALALFCGGLNPGALPQASSEDCAFGANTDAKGEAFPRTCRVSFSRHLKLTIEKQYGCLESN